MKIAASPPVKIGLIGVEVAEDVIKLVQRLPQRRGEIPNLLIPRTSPQCGTNEHRDKDADGSRLINRIGQVPAEFVSEESEEGEERCSGQSIRSALGLPGDDSRGACQRSL